MARETLQTLWTPYLGGSRRLRLSVCWASWPVGLASTSLPEGGFQSPPTHANIPLSPPLPGLEASPNSSLPYIQDPLSAPQLSQGISPSCLFYTLSYSQSL